MFKRASFIGLCLGLLVLFVPIGQAQDFEKGLWAFQQGDYATALREWRPLAERGNALLQYELGAMYAEGKGVIQNHATAVEWYRKSAEQGFFLAQYNLGQMYRQGLGVAQSDAVALTWFHKASKQGFAQAQFLLGAMYVLVKGETEENAQIAYIWLNIASANGHEESRVVKEFIEEKMPSDLLAESQRLAKKCLDSNYTQCP